MTTKKSVDLADLKAAAKELNTVLGLDPRIKVVGVSADHLTKTVKQGAEFIDWETDEFTKETLVTLGLLGFVNPNAAEAAEETEEEAAEEQAEEQAEETAPEPEEEAAEDTLVDEINAIAKKAPEKAMKALRAMIKDDDLFKSIRKKSLTVFEVGELVEMMKGALPATAATEPKPKKEQKTAKKEKGPGVISIIANCIEKSGKKGITKDAILEVLKEEFPDRAEQSMKNTINVQVPNRISKEKFQVEKLEGGLYRKA